MLLSFLYRFVPSVSPKESFQDLCLFNTSFSFHNILQKINLLASGVPFLYDISSLGSLVHLKFALFQYLGCHLWEEWTMKAWSEQKLIYLSQLMAQPWWYGLVLKLFMFLPFICRYCLSLDVCFPLAAAFDSHSDSHTCL